ATSQCNLGVGEEKSRAPFAPHNSGICGVANNRRQQTVAATAVELRTAGGSGVTSWTAAAAATATMDSSGRQWIAVEAEGTRSATKEDSKAIGEIVGIGRRGRKRRVGSRGRA
ncbi:hypothetical protein GW17_00028007, partial [Ensete ventricosum]